MTTATSTLERKSSVFTPTQTRYLRDVADSRFAELTQKVYELRFDIYNEVMETEMQMTSLVDESFNENISPSANKVQNRALLAKMNTLKKQILTRKYGDNMPPELLQSSSEEEDERSA